MEVANTSTRGFWEETALKVSLPVLEAGASSCLKKEMPLHLYPQRKDRETFAHLEAVARLLCGIAPWLELLKKTKQEAEHGYIVTKAQKTLISITDPTSPDYLNYKDGQQPLVDIAFLAQAIVRAPNVLCNELPNETRLNLIGIFKETRKKRPHFNNWLLFSAMIEAFLLFSGEDWDSMRVDYALKQHEQWYLGDGAYGDGKEFRWDYYNSYVIHPMLLDICHVCKQEFRDWDVFASKAIKRAQRYAVVLERMISPDGTFPPLGRSITYRAAAFHALAHLVLLKQLPQNLRSSSINSALTSVIQTTLTPNGTFTDSGWLTIGLSGSQQNQGESYISSGSSYLTSTIFLPLGLREEDSFWSMRPSSFTQQKVWWLGNDMTPDTHL